MTKTDITSFLFNKSLLSTPPAQEEVTPAPQSTKKTLIYGEHDDSALPDTPMDVVNLHLKEAQRVAKGPMAERLQKICELTEGLDTYCEASSAPMSELMKDII